MIGYTVILLLPLSFDLISAQNGWDSTSKRPFQGQAGVAGESYYTNPNTQQYAPPRPTEPPRYVPPVRPSFQPGNDYQNQNVQKHNPGQAQLTGNGETQPNSQQNPPQIPQGNPVAKPPSAPQPTASNQGQPVFQYDEASLAVTELARKIGQVVGQQSNVGIFSPVSIACALALLLLGSNGATKEELRQAMGFNSQRLNDIHRQYGHLLNSLASSDPDKYPITWRRNDRCSEDDFEEDEIEKQVINLANAIFVRNGLSINQRFIDLSHGIYNSSLRPLNFAENAQQAAADINYWASQNTFGKITQIVSDYLNPNTQMIVANALYFKGLWKNTFEVQATSLKKFFPNGYDSPNTAKEVPSMVSIGCYPYFDGSDEFGAKIIGLPYQGEKTALYILVPNNSNRQALLKFQQTLDAAKIGTMVSRMAVKKALIQIPKMKISNTLNLRDVLEQLNVRSIFSPASSDLSPMLSSTSQPSKLQKTPKRPQNQQPQQQQQQQQRLYASEIVHKVELDINEKGTEGGAITASTIFRSLPSVQMRIDTPFLMLLGHDETRLPLFYGCIFDPTG